MKPSCNQLKTLESIQTIPALQNGRLVLSERNVAEGRFYVQTGHYGCIFFSTISSILKKICQIFMVRESFCQRIPKGGKGKSEEKEIHVNILELKVVKLALMSFHKQIKMKAVHFQINKTTALMYLLKMGGTGNKGLLDLSKDTRDYILKNGITITAEYLPSCLNVEADWQSKNPRDSSEWELLPQIFHQICQIKGTPEICISVVTSASKIFCLETGSIQSGYGRNAASVGKQIFLCIPTFLNDQ